LPNRPGADSHTSMRISGGFISFEGGEGSGKSTQVSLLHDLLVQRGHDVVLTREPGGTPTGEMIRDILQHHASGEDICTAAEVLLFAASRAQHVAHVIRPALERGAWVLCDRFVDSSLAYQSGGREIDLDTVLTVNETALAGTWPDCTIWFDLPADAAAARMTERGAPPDRIEAEKDGFHERVAAMYARVAQRFPERIHRIDADQPVEKVAAETARIIQHVFGERW